MIPKNLGTSNFGYFVSNPSVSAVENLGPSDAQGYNFQSIKDITVEKKVSGTFIKDNEVEGVNEDELKEISSIVFNNL